MNSLCIDGDRLVRSLFGNPPTVPKKRGSRIALSREDCRGWSEPRRHSPVRELVGKPASTFPDLVLDRDVEFLRNLAA